DENPFAKAGRLSRPRRTGQPRPVFGDVRPPTTPRVGHMGQRGAGARRAMTSLPESNPSYRSLAAPFPYRRQGPGAAGGAEGYATGVTRPWQTGMAAAGNTGSRPARRPGELA